jgi:hypothetical protein
MDAYLEIRPPILVLRRGRRAVSRRSRSSDWNRLFTH